MFTILFHSSKTMRASSERTLRTYSEPPLRDDASRIMTYLKNLDELQLQKSMKLSPAMAVKTHALYQDWQERSYTLPAIDAFLGDMYSGLQSRLFNTDDRAYAHKHFFILSGLYGVVRALDNISPYRLEMGYKLPDEPFNNLYTYWGSRIAEQLPSQRPILNLSVPEYTKTVFTHLKDAQIITPVFLTVRPGSSKPQTVVIHSKIARGAFAHWVIKNRINTVEALQEFDGLGYHYNATLSTPTQPAYVTKEFQGLGLSVRLT